MNTPKLRFKEFTEQYKSYKLKELSEKKNQKNSRSEISEVFTNSASQGVIPQRDFFDRDIANQNNLSGYYIIEQDDFVYNPRISNLAPVGPIKRNHNGTGVMSPLYTVFGINSNFNKSFAEFYFSTNKWHKYLQSIANYGVRADRMNITSDGFFSMPIFLPSLEEQQKIASFFTAVDQKLTTLKKKKELLEQYKKGVMQQIFSQKLRFKDDAGNPFPEWEERKLGNIGNTFNGLTGKTSDDFGEGSYYIQYKQVFDNSKIDLSKFGKVKVEANENQNKVQYGDVIFTTSSETPHEIGISSVLLDTVENLYLNSFCFGFRPNSLEETHPSYLRFLFRSDFFRNKLLKLAQGSTRYNMSKSEFLKLNVSFPIIKEQQKIADFLSAIDNKMNAVAQQIEKTEQWKKGLLQKMFV